MAASATKYKGTWSPLLRQQLVRAVFYIVMAMPFLSVWYTMNDAMPSMSAEVGLNPQSRRSILEDLVASSDWNVSKLQINSTQAAAYVVRSLPKSSRACLLVLENVCHVLSSRPSEEGGLWFDPSGADLSAIGNGQDDICGFLEHLPHPLFGQGDVYTVRKMQRQVGVFSDKSDAESRRWELTEDYVAEEVEDGQVSVPLIGDMADEDADEDEDVPKERNMIATRQVSLALVSPHNAHLGHFVEFVGGLVEVAEEIEKARAQGSRDPSVGSDIAVFFPSAADLGQWMQGVVGLIFGDRATTILGWGEGTQKMSVVPDLVRCFDHVLFPFNSMHSQKSVQTFRRRVEELAGKTKPSALPRKMQVTIFKREKMRTITNMVAVADAVKSLFPEYQTEVILPHKLTFAQQVSTMWNSAIMISMHGAGLSNVIFMREGTTVVELFPYKFEYHNYGRIARRFGLNYLTWHNTHRERSKYKDNCLTAGGFEDWKEHRCHLDIGCRFCVRDGAETTVDIEELKSVLRKAADNVRDWTKKMGSDAFKPSEG